MDSARETAPTLSVIIPALNEAQSLPYLSAELPEDLHEVIVLDGPSASQEPF
jgi:glycosyltransferase involved in cell wall biosynthesis